MRIYASPSYLEQNPTPKSIEDLSSHKLIIYNGDDRTLEEINIHINTPNDHITSFINVNNGLSLREALLTGLGIGPYEYNRDLVKNNLLIDVFPDMPDHIIPYYFTYHRRLDGSPKVQAFYEFLKEVSKVWTQPDEKELPSL